MVAFARRMDFVLGGLRRICREARGNGEGWGGRNYYPRKPPWRQHRVTPRRGELGVHAEADAGSSMPRPGFGGHLLSVAMEVPSIHPPMRTADREEYPGRGFVGASSLERMGEASRPTPEVQILKAWRQKGLSASGRVEAPDIMEHTAGGGWPMYLEDPVAQHSCRRTRPEARRR